MEVNIKLKPESKGEGVENKGNFLLVYLKMKVDNSLDMTEANKQMLKLISSYYNVPARRIKINQGLEEFNKVVDVSSEDETKISS